MENFFSHFYNSFKKVNGHLFGSFSLILAFVVWIWSSNSKVSFGLFIPLVLFFIILIITLIDLSYTLYIKQKNLLPKVIQGREPPSLFNESEALIIVTESKLFSHEALISLFLIEDGYERLIGVGNVLTVQNDGMIQIIITKSLVEESENIWERVRSNNKIVIEKLLVKPNIPKILFQLR